MSDSSVQCPVVLFSFKLLSLAWAELEHLLWLSRGDFCSWEALAYISSVLGILFLLCSWRAGLLLKSPWISSS